MNAKRNLPKSLPGRDPRNSAHIDAAMRVLTTVGPNIITEQSAAEVAAFGGVIPKTFRVRKKIGKHDFVVGSFFFLERGLMYPDNVIVKCKDCSSALEIRPHTNTAAPKLCCFCAADRKLRDYWRSH